MSFSVLFSRYNTVSSNKSKRSWFNQKQRKRKNFPIGEMPRLAMNLVIRSMDTLEQIMLALTSKRIEYCVRMAKVKVSYISVQVKDEFSRIVLADDTVDPLKKVLLCYGYRTPEKLQENETTVTRLELEQWCNNGSIVDNMINVFKKVEYIFSCKQLQLVFYLDNMKKISAKELVSIPAFQNYSSLQYIGNGGKIDSDELNFIINMAKPEQIAGFQNTEIATDFQNGNAFKFYGVEYADARWVKIEDLYSLRNRDLVILGNNNLNFSHFNTFIKYWINSDCDMFEQLIIKVNEERNDFYDGLVVLKYSNYNPSSYLVAAKNKENRKKPILDIYYLTGDVVMTACSPETYEEDYEILRLLERKEELKKEMMETEDKAKEIRDEIQKLDNKLTEYKVYYEEGVPTINPRNT